MFSALKRLVSNQDGRSLGEDEFSKNCPSGVRSMDHSLQRRFAKGVQYNSKYIPWIYDPKVNDLLTITVFSENCYQRRP